MKVIFLDIDGVLNSDLWYQSDKNPGNLYGEQSELDPDAIALLNKITDITGANIVISSDWRLFMDETIFKLTQAGLTGNIIDKTPYIWKGYNNSPRGNEIAAYLKKHDDIESYVIIDDRTDFLEDQLSHFEHINHYTGLTEDNVNNIINILEKNKLFLFYVI